MRLQSLFTMSLVAGAALVFSGGSSSGAVVFQDTFEDATAGAPPNAPQVGAYPTSTLTDPESLVVAAGGSHPASPAGGTNILHITGKDRNYGLFSSSATGVGTVRLELDARLDASSDNNFGLLGNSTGPITLDGFPITVWIRLGLGGTIYAYEAGWHALPGVSHTVGEWQHYVLDYELGADEFTLTAGANQLTADYLTGTAATQVDGVLLAQGGTDATIGYTDNVVGSFEPIPEPSSLAIVAMGGLLLVRRQRRSRA